MDHPLLDPRYAVRVDETPDDRFMLYFTVFSSCRRGSRSFVHDRAHTIAPRRVHRQFSFFRHRARRVNAMIWVENMLSKDEYK